MQRLKQHHLEYILSFQHPRKRLAGLTGWNDPNEAALFGLPVERFREIRQLCRSRMEAAAEAVLAEPQAAGHLATLPVEAGQTVVAFGDSITDDWHSWAEMLGVALRQRFGQKNIKLINAGLSGDTTAEMLSRFLSVVHTRPAWILCLAGTNNARRHGPAPAEPLLSPAETRRHLQRMHAWAEKASGARWVWLSPPPVIEGRQEVHWSMGPGQMTWRNADLEAIAAVTAEMPGTFVDLQQAFGHEPDREWYLADGLHPSVAGQQAILRALLATWARS